CPACRQENSDIIEDMARGELICRDCGFILEERTISEDAEWRSFDDDDIDRSRVGAATNPLLLEDELFSFVSRSNYSSSSLYSQQRIQTSSAVNKNLITSFELIKNMADRLCLPETVMNRANEIFSHVNKTIRTNKGRSPNGYASASLYLSCRTQGMPRTIGEVLSVSDRVSKKDIGRCINNITKSFSTTASPQAVAPDAFITRICANLELSHEIRRLSERVSIKSAELSLNEGRKPISVAAGCVYYVVNQLISDKSVRLSLQSVSDVTGVSTTTVSNVYKELVANQSSLTIA
ncbi:hypothetical protein SAMD00019534_057380, partial [Acytostelium subglobosum LB1]|uniref:hypothetical protein n=1 Tax=Acytostelium subglobosum LB1 TaxID=1410327 RepID=UPI00064484D2